MIFNSKGLINEHFLQFAATSFYYTLGYPVLFANPSGLLEPYAPCEVISEPYAGYLSRQLLTSIKKLKTNLAQILYLELGDLVILYPIYNKSIYLGSIIVGPLMIARSWNFKDAHTFQYSTEIAKDDKSLHLISSKIMDSYKMHFDQECQNEFSAKEEVAPPVKNTEYDEKEWNRIQYSESIPQIEQFQIQYLVNVLNLMMHSDYYNPTVISTLTIIDHPSPQTMPSFEKSRNPVLHHSIEQEEKILQQLLLSSDSFTSLAMKYFPKLSNLVAPPLAGNPVRSEKNRFIVSATIIARAAIQLGMPSDAAFSYSDHFINVIEDCRDLNEIWDLQMSLFHFYRKELKAIRNQPLYSNTTCILLTFIESHMGTNLSLQEICMELKLDYKYASNCFKKDTGLGFNKYLTKVKMSAAKRQLLTTENSIQQIAECLGFGSAYYFTRTFKGYYGITPTEFRKRFINIVDGNSSK